MNTETKEVKNESTLPLNILIFTISLGLAYVSAPLFEKGVSLINTLKETLL